METENFMAHESLFPDFYEVIHLVIRAAAASRRTLVFPVDSDVEQVADLVLLVK